MKSLSVNLLSYLSAKIANKFHKANYYQTNQHHRQIYLPWHIHRNQIFFRGFE